MFKLSEKLAEYFYHPKHIGELPLADPNVLMSEIITPDQQTHLQLFLKIDNQEIIEAKFKALGCPAAIGCLSYVCEYLTGKNLQAINNISVEYLVKTLELPKEKYAVAGLIEELAHFFLS